MELASTVEKRKNLPDWKQQLLKFTEHLPRPENTGATASEVLTKAEQIDSIVWNRHPDLQSTIEEYGVDTNTLEIVEVKPDIFRLAVKEHFHQQRLPEGYVYKGGSANLTNSGARAATDGTAEGH